MKKRLSQLITSLLLVLVVVNSSFCTAAEETESETTEPQTPAVNFVKEGQVQYVEEEMKPLQLKYVGHPVENIPEELLTVTPPEGATPIVLDDWQWGKKDAVFNGQIYEMQYGETPSGQGYHRLYRAYGGSPKNGSAQFEVKPNAEYKFSVLYWSEFTRNLDVYDTYINKNANYTREISASMEFYDEDGHLSLRRGIGFEDWSGDAEGKNGWKRVEFTVSAGLLESAKTARLTMVCYAMMDGSPESNILIADWQLWELPAKPLQPYNMGEGVTFRGGAGNLDMKVENVVEADDAIVVNTSGTRYTFDTANDIITAEQKINMERTVSTWKSDRSFRDLQVMKWNEKEAVICNANITFGVQLDGNLFLTPHGGDVKLVCTSGIAGQWNRYSNGYLLSYDDMGGFSVTPDIPIGTQRVCRSKPLTEGLDFTKLAFKNHIDEPDAERNWMISNSKAGWQFEYVISPGERLCIGTFPPRKMDWNSIFNKNHRSVWPAAVWALQMQKNKEKEELASVTLWSFSWYGSMGNQYSHFYQIDSRESIMRDMVSSAKKNGVKPIMYTSMHFYKNRYSPDRYIQEVQRLKDEYGIEGVYSDGTPAEGAWIVAYEESRMLREMFPDGVLFVHSSGVPANGGLPLSTSDFCMPNIDTYYDATLKGEGVGVTGYENPAMHMTMSQYRLGNTVGKLKSDGWYVLDEKGERKLIDATEAGLITMLHGGMAGTSSDMTVILPLRAQLKKAVEQYIDEPQFYEKYYAPKARALFHERLGHIQNVAVIDGHDMTADALQEDYALEQVTVENTTHNDGDVAVKIRGNEGVDHGSVFKRTMSLSGEITVNFDIKIDEAGDYAYTIVDDYAGHHIGLQFSNDDKLKLRTSDGGYSTLCRLERNRWHNISLTINTDRHRMDVNLDGESVIQDVLLPEDVYYINNHEFSASGVDTVFCIDNFKVAFSY